MLQTGTITFSYDGLFVNSQQREILHIEIQVVSPKGSIIETKNIKLNVRTEDEQHYQATIKSAAKRCQSKWMQLTGEIYNVQFSGL